MDPLTQKYTINGKQFDNNGAMGLCCEKSLNGQPWEVELYRFIQFWLSGASAIPMYSSGSTGSPKEMDFPREAVIASARATIEFFELNPGDKILLCLPIRYVAARLMVVRALEGNLDLQITAPSGNPLVDLRESISFAAMVPLQVIDALDQCPQQFGLIKKLIVGGSAIAPQLKDKLQQIPTQVWETYGMTETLTHVAVRQVNGHSPSNYFEALPGVGFSVDENECLVIDIPRVSPKPLLTRDVVQLIDPVRFILLGRLDNVINSGGIKLQPESIEARLRPYVGLPFVIVGLPDVRLGQKVVLVVEGHRRSLDQILGINISDIGKYEKPKEIIFVDKIPVGENGKVLRKQLMDFLLNNSNL
ncbi:MAG: AMP-binding protein [Breznakibacter sp.]